MIEEKSKEALEFAKKYIGQSVRLLIDRPVGFRDRDRGITYPINYGVIEGVILPNGEKLHGYLMFIDVELIEVTVTCVAVVYRKDDDNPELILAALEGGEVITDQEIKEGIGFKENIDRVEIAR